MLLLRTAAALLLTATVTSASLAQEVPSYAGLVEQAVAASIRPSYVVASERFAELERAVSGRCDVADRPDGPEVERAFAGAVVAWARVQHLRFGPVMEQDRYLSIFFWPDPRNFTGRHLRGLEAALGERPLNAESLTQMSVAVQSLPALERIVTGAGEAADVALPPCPLASAIAANLHNMMAETAAAWAEGAAYPQLLAQPGPENPLYRDHREAVSEVFKALSSGLQFMSERTLLPVVGDSVETARPRRAVFRHSGLTMPHLRASFEGLESYYLEGGFSAAVAQRAPEVDARIRDRFEQLGSTLDAIEGALPDSVVDPAQRARWQYVQTLADRLVVEVNGGASAALGLSRGFNAFDGD